MNIPLLPTLLCSYVLFKLLQPKSTNTAEHQGQKSSTTLYRPQYTIPKQSNFSEEDIASFMKDNSFVTLITVAMKTNSTTPDVYTSFLPVVYDKQRNVIRAHLANMNPHMKFLQSQEDVFHVEHVLLFHGPHCYISPTWYKGFRDRAENSVDSYVPTWNYSLVKITSKHCTLLQDEKVKYELVNELSQLHEQFRQTNLDSSSTYIYSLDKEPKEDIGLELRGITGVEFSVDSIEVKMKMSQNKNEETMSLLTSILDSLPFESFRNVSTIMKKFSAK